MSSHTWGVIGLVVGFPIVLLLGVWYVVETIKGGEGT